MDVDDLMLLFTVKVENHQHDGATTSSYHLRTVVAMEDVLVLFSVRERQTGVARYNQHGHAGQTCCRHHHAHLQVATGASIHTTN